jgi:hypothetical protein
MNVRSEVQNPAQTIQDRIVPLLYDLPSESLTVAEQFVKFLRDQARRGQAVVAGPEKEKKEPPYRYPTVPVPASSLDGLVGIMPPVGGDALADTEALYEEV